MEQLALLEEKQMQKLFFLCSLNHSCDSPKNPKCAVRFDSSRDTNTLFSVNITLIISLMKTEIGRLLAAETIFCVFW